MRWHLPADYFISFSLEALQRLLLFGRSFRVAGKIELAFVYLVKLGELTLFSPRDLTRITAVLGRVRLDCERIVEGRIKLG